MKIKRPHNYSEWPQMKPFIFAVVKMPISFLFSACFAGKVRVSVASTPTLFALQIPDYLIANLTNKNDHTLANFSFDQSKHSSINWSSRRPLIFMITSRESTANQNAILHFTTPWKSFMMAISLMLLMLWLRRCT